MGGLWGAWEGEGWNCAEEERGVGMGLLGVVWFDVYVFMGSTTWIEWMVAIHMVWCWQVSDCVESKLYERCPVAIHLCIYIFKHTWQSHAE